MLSGNQLLVGGLAAGGIAVIGSLANLTTLHLLLDTARARANPTTVLIIFLTASNLVYTGLVLPQTAASMLNTKWVWGILHGSFLSYIFTESMKKIPSIVNSTPFCSSGLSFPWFSSRWLWQWTGGRWSAQKSSGVRIVLHVSSLTLGDIHHLSYTVSSSIVSGLVCWLAALLVCLIPTSIDRSQQFGWDPEYGGIMVKLWLIVSNLCIWQVLVVLRVDTKEQPSSYFV